MPVRKSTVTLLPIECAREPFLLVNKVAGIGLDLPNQVGQCHKWPKSNQNVDVVGHTVDRDQLMFLVRNNTCHVALKLLPVLRRNQILSTLWCEDYLYINLAIGVCHYAGCARLSLN